MKVILGHGESKENEAVEPETRQLSLGFSNVMGKCIPKLSPIAKVIL